jgi:DUF1009 family protein
MTDARGEESGAVAIMCGGGSVPLVVADAAARSGRRVVLFPLRGFADGTDITRYPHHWVALGQVGRFLRLARADRCRDIVMVGWVTRPSIWQIRFDALTIRLFPRILRLMRGGDDRLLSGLAKILEEYGLRLVAPDELAPQILLPEGTLGRHQPSERDRSDIERGMALLTATGGFDIGQAVVVAEGRVLAIEAAEGTDQMLARIADLRRDGRLPTANRTGVLIKAPKSGQDRRVDLPSIGPATVEKAAEAGLVGIAVEAVGAITPDLQALIHAADAAGLFVVGVPATAGAAP